MKRLLSPLLLLLLAVPLFAAASDWQERLDWGKSFADAGINGTLLVYDERSDRWFVHDAKRAKHPYLPASTFKLFNALVALDTEAVKDEYEVARWDGKVRRLGGEPYPMWNRDQTLASAMRYSALWFYQEMARRAGPHRMQKWLDSTGYGNRKMGGSIDQFWLDGMLRISAEQQIDFLRRLADGHLPFSERAQEAVRRISITESQPGYVLHAKTGWATDAGDDAVDKMAATDLGWYVGWVESKGRRWFFAFNNDIRSAEDTPKRIALTKQVLAELGAL